ncbi:MAG: hypothetical protein NTZ50_12525, partial [Chloroflexi bacterium]|nr:hypothetical protein [Chloroflexota bacterium]
FGAFSALKGRTSIQPGFVRKARPWQRRGADIRMLSGDPQVLPGRTTMFVRPLDGELDPVICELLERRRARVAIRAAKFEEPLAHIRREIREIRPMVWR